MLNIDVADNVLKIETLIEPLENVVDLTVAICFCFCAPDYRVVI